MSLYHKTASLTANLLSITQDACTEPPGSHPHPLKDHGSYLCRQCGLALFTASDQFESHCGWPSFDDRKQDHIITKPDPDGQRTEVCCAACDAHLGHVFSGEHLTDKNTRYCINGCAIEWVAKQSVTQTDECIVAGGCFWGVEHLLKSQPGVLKTEVGYCGGTLEDPHYEDICRGDSGHVEAVRIVFDPQTATLTSLYQYFLEIHDPYQADGQGPDIGSQYHSVIFCYPHQRTDAQQLLDQLAQIQAPPCTRIEPMAIFWKAEEAHQQYYNKHHQQPYCHRHTPRFKR